MSVGRRLLGIRLRVGGKNNRPSLTTPPARSARVGDASGGQFRTPQWHAAHGVRQRAILCPPGAAPISRPAFLFGAGGCAHGPARTFSARRENSDLLFGSALPTRAGPRPANFGWGVPRRRRSPAGGRGPCGVGIRMADTASLSPMPMAARCRWTLSPLADPTALSLQRPTRSPLLPISLHGRSLGLAAARSCYEQNRKVQSPDPSPLSVHFANVTRAATSARISMIDRWAARAKSLRGDDVLQCSDSLPLVYNFGAYFH